MFYLIEHNRRCNSFVFVFVVLQTVEQWDREKKARADVEKVKRKLEGDLKVRCC